MYVLLLEKDVKLCVCAWCSSQFFSNCGVNRYSDSQTSLIGRIRASHYIKPVYNTTCFIYIFALLYSYNIIFEQKISLYTYVLEIYLRFHLWPHTVEIYSTKIINNWKRKLNSVALVRERTIPTERPPLVGEVVPTFADRGCCVVSATDSHGR
jgi:hypothetical protein